MAEAQAKKDIRNLLKLLKEVSTKTQVQDLLKKKSCVHSGTWDEILEKRIPEGIDAELLSESDLVDLVDSAEANSAQHVFLYSCSSKLAASIINDAAAMKKNLRRKRVGYALNNTSLSPTPEHLKLASVRYDLIGSENILTLKFLETRISKERISIESKILVSGEIEVQKYKIERHRAISTVRLRSTGLLEIRIGSAGKSGLVYKAELDRIWAEALNYIDLERFNLYSLTNFKEEIGDYYTEYEEDIRLKSVAIRNDNDQLLIGKSGVGSGGVGKDALSALTQFKNDGGQHDHSSVIFLLEDEDNETTEITANFRGQPHEFSLTKQVLGEQYEYILKFIRDATENFSKRS